MVTVCARPPPWAVLAAPKPLLAVHGKPLLQWHVQALAAGDVYAPDCVFGADAVRRFQDSSMLAHLWLVPNPEHNPRWHRYCAPPWTTAG